MCRHSAPSTPAAPLPDLFEAVADVTGTGRFLPYDNDQRRSDRTTERILPGDVQHDERRTLIPTLTERGHGTIKVHIYGPQPDSLTVGPDLARKLATTHGAATARIVVPRPRTAPDPRPPMTRLVAALVDG